jgi:tetratricopeptide (TPR) repeat protein
VLDQLCEDGTGALLDSAAGPDVIAPERFSRFAAAADRIGAACRREAACLLLDDVHAADPGALLLTRFVARLLHGLPLLIVAARRPDLDLDPTCSRLLDALDQEGTLSVLRPFDTSETGAFLRAHAGSAPADDLVSAVQRVTGGNPLFLTRLVALASPDLPQGLENAIQESLHRLPPGTRAVLARAAILGRSPSVADTAAVTGCAVPDVLEAIERGTSEGLCGESGTGNFSFSHDLVRDVLAASLRPATRLDVHARAAAVAGERGARWAEALVRQAYHAEQAAIRSPEDARRAVAACRAAASSVGRNFAYEHAANLLARAVALHEHGPLGPPPAALLVERARAVLNCGQLTEARTLFGEAAGAAESDRAPIQFAEAALGLGGVWVNEHRTPAEHERVIGLQRRALAGVPSDQRALRCRLKTRLAAEAVYQGGPMEPVFAALEEARRCDDGRALAEALSLCHHVMLTAAHTEARLAIAEELISVASAAGEGVLTLMGLCWRTVDLFHLGDPLAEQALTDLRDRADALGCRSILFIARVLEVTLLIRAGELEKAEEKAAEAYQLGTAVGDADALAYYGAQLVTIRWLQGRAAEILDMLEEVASSPTLVRAEFALRASVAVLAVQAGRPERARAMLDNLTRAGLAALPDSSTWLAGMQSIVEAASGLGDRALAREAYGVLLPYAHLPILPSLAVICFGSVERSIGLAASTFGDATSAVDHLTRAVEANTRLGNRPFTACARADLAVALSARHEKGDNGRAAALLDEAIAGARSMGMDARAASWEATLESVRRGAVRRGTIERHGANWKVAIDDRQAFIPHRVGMTYLAVLLTHPGESIDALALAAGGQPIPEPSRQPLLDDNARRAYARRAREVLAEIESARDNADLGRVELLQPELDALVGELDRSEGRGGRDRGFAGPVERARTSVQKAIKRALDEIDAAEPAIGGALRASVTTGIRCCYAPALDDEVRWSG